MNWALWVAQQVERLALGFGTGHDCGVTGLSPTSGSVWAQQWSLLVLLADPSPTNVTRSTT